MSLQDNRRRQHEEPHERTIERQILDALLRIEEILLFAHPDNRATPYTGEDVTDLITMITPTKTPFMEAGAGGLIGGTSGLTEDEPMKKSKGRRR
jgi:hypothetical protein